MSNWEPLPTTLINFVPLAIEARSLGGFNASHFLRVEDGGEPKNAPVLSSADATELRALLDGSSTLYMPRSSDTGATLPAFSGGGAPSAPQPGSIWFDSDDGAIKFYDGTTTVTLGSGSGGGGVTSITAGAGLTGGTITTSGTIALEDYGTPGTYFKVTTDAKGRVTSGSATLDAADIPPLDWSKISSGKPTTVDGYGITDAVKNAGGVASIQTGDDASKPAAGTTGRIYIAWDAQKVYLDNGTSWTVVASVDAGGGGGTVTEVSVSGAPLSVTNGTTTPQISITQAGASSSGYLSQTDWNTFNSKLGPALEAGKIFVGNSSDIAAAVTPSGDVSLNEDGVFSVTGIQGQAVDSTAPSAAGQVLRWDSTKYAVTFASKTANTVFAAPNGASGAPTFRALVEDDIPNLDWSKITGTPSTLSGYGISDAVIKGGQSGALSLGSTDANALKLMTNNAAQLTIASDGKVGIGTESPTAIFA